LFESLHEILFKSNDSLEAFYLLGTFLFLLSSSCVCVRAVKKGEGLNFLFGTWLLLGDGRGFAENKKGVDKPKGILLYDWKASCPQAGLGSSSR